MPLLKILTNCDKPDVDLTALQADLATQAAHLVGKKVDYVMTTLEFTEYMTFAGTSEPTAYVEFKNIGPLDAELTRILSNVICTSVEATLGVSSKRIYIEFQEATRHHWGWNRDNFA